MEKVGDNGSGQCPGRLGGGIGPGSPVVGGRLHRPPAADGLRNSRPNPGTNGKAHSPADAKRGRCAHYERNACPFSDAHTHSDDTADSHANGNPDSNGNACSCSKANPDSDP